MSDSFLYGAGLNPDHGSDKKTAPHLRGWHHAGVPFAKPYIPVVGDEFINRVSQKWWYNPESLRPFPVPGQHAIEAKTRR